MTYNIKGSWKFNTDVNCDIYVPNREDTATVSISFTSNNKSYTSFKFQYGSTYYMFYDYDYAYMGSWDEPNYQTIDFGDEYQEIDETFYNFITSSATPITGFIQRPIVINVTSAEGVTLATEKTIINQNIKVTIDESLLAGGISGYPIEIDDMSKADLNAIGKVYKYVGDTNDTYTNGYLYVIEEV